MLGKLFGTGAIGAILGALLAKTVLPAADTSVKHGGDLLVFAIAFAGIFLACMAEVKFVLNEHVGLKDKLRTTFLAGAVERCVPRQSAAAENAGIEASVITAYCDCYANGVADRVSFNQLKGYTAAGALPGVLVESVVGTCRAQVVR